MSRLWIAVDWVVALALSVFGVLLVSGATSANAHRPTGAAASLLVLTMTLPVAWRRRAPIAVAVVLGAGGVLNYVIIGPMVRCGPALPALLLSAYAVGRFPATRNSALDAVALGCLFVSATVQCLTDPQLQPVVMIALTPFILGLFGAGLLVKSRTAMAAELDRRNAELVLRRRQRTQLAVEADRAMIAEHLEGSLHSGMDEIGAAAESGRRALSDAGSPEEAKHAFETIQRTGRATLGHMRTVVGTLRDEDLSAPQPSLSQLDRLLERAGSADVRLHVTGRPRVLPPGVELSAYRALEHLLHAYGSGKPIDIDVDFATEELGMTVRGSAPDAPEMANALASVRARVELHNGALQSECPDGMWVTNVRLPIGADA